MLRLSRIPAFCGVLVCGAVIFGEAEASRAAILTSDGDFGAQTPGANLTLPWNPRSTAGVTATAAAQSPFTNLFANNGKGSLWPAANSSTNRYIVGKFTPALPASATGLLDFNADFRNTSEGANESAGYTLVVTSGSAWNNRTVALYVGRDAVYAESAAGFGSSLLDPALNTWYNVRMTLNLNTNTYSGLITGQNGTTAVISPRSFVLERAIDCIYTDYGTQNAFPSRTDTITTPTHEIDNFALLENTRPPVVNIDFNGVRDGDVVGPTYLGVGAGGSGVLFNGLLADSRSPNGDNLTVSGTDLLDSYGNVTSVDFTVAPVGGDVGGAATTDPTSSNALFGDYIFNHSAGNTSDSPFTISGLDGFLTADLYFYKGSWEAASRIKVDGETSDPFTPNGIYRTDNTVLFANVPIVNGQITGKFSGGTAVITGLSIVMKVPEPSALVLLGPALIGMVGCIWRRRRS